MGKWSHIEETVNISRRYSGNVVAFPKITSSCLNPKWREKMKVSYAAHIFSRSLASQMDIFVGLGMYACIPTQKMFLLFTSLISAINLLQD
jgi:hypothetical protein